MIEREYEKKLREKMAIFRTATETRLSARVALVTTYGVLKNKHSGIVDDEIVLDDLFTITDETK